MSAFAAGLGDHRINTALCPGGKERMRGLLAVVESSRVDLGVLVTHKYKLDDIVAAYDLFANQRDGVLMVAIKPAWCSRICFILINALCTRAFFFTLRWPSPQCRST